MGKCKIYFQPLRMFRQIDCHLQEVSENCSCTCSCPIHTPYILNTYIGLKIYFTFANNLVRLLVDLENARCTQHKTCTCVWFVLRRIPT